MRDTLPMLKEIAFPLLARMRLETLQANLGYRCNQSCAHCHVGAGPNRTEEMSAETIEAVLAFLAHSGASTLDLTGGAPELNPHFRYLVKSAVDLGVKVIDRCNLTILEEQGQDGLAVFLAENGVTVIASLPCYLKDNVDRQRGNGVFESSIRGIRHLNDLGYGQKGTGLELDLVYNPQGPILPPPQEKLEAAYKQQLAESYGIFFNRLYTLANMPIRRFGSMLLSNGQFEAYMELLKGAHSAANLDGVMCRTLLSIDWQGYVYDCDFNQMLDIPLLHGSRHRIHISELVLEELAVNPIQVAGHCYGCTAGQGSSCRGALNPAD